MHGLPVAASILVLNSVSVFLIVRSRRFGWERSLRKRYGIDRHWWIPLIALSFAFLFSIIGFSAVRTAFLEKFEIITLIFSFGVMAEGLRASGFFRHLAYRIVEICNGETSKLILSMFLLTSAATFFTTNDIVIYVLTPIIVAICFQAGLKNTKLILLSQFIAANTLSMGLLIGSPTNLIIADSMGLDFFSYFFLMVLPAFVAFSASFLLLKLMIKVLQGDRFSFFPDMEFQKSYSIPDENPEPEFTSLMRNWVLIFGFFVALVAAVTYLGFSLLWCAVPSIIISLVYWHFSSEHSVSVKKPLGNLPYGIFFFGMTFFIFAEQFSRTGFVNSELVPFLHNFFESSPLKTILTGVFGSGVLVNIFNDLPASALVSQTLPKLELSFLTEKILTQASLIGLNIGTYVTEIGALAGLIWFEEMRLQRREQSTSSEILEQMSFPDRIDLVRYGLLHFLFAGGFAAIFLILEWLVLSAL